MVTLSPQAILDKEPDTSIGQGLGPEVAGLLQRQVWASVLVSLLIDHEPEGDVGRDVATRWAHVEWMADVVRPVQRCSAWNGQFQDRRGVYMRRNPPAVIEPAGQTALAAFL